MDKRTRRLIVAARKVAFELQTPITEADDRARIKELDEASEAFAADVPWDNAP